MKGHFYPSPGHGDTCKHCGKSESEHEYGPLSSDGGISRGMVARCPRVESENAWWSFGFGLGYAIGAVALLAVLVLFVRLLFKVLGLDFPLGPMR